MSTAEYERLGDVHTELEAIREEVAGIHKIAAVLYLAVVFAAALYLYSSWGVSLHHG